MNDARPQGITVRIEERAADARIAHLSIDNVRRLNSLNSALMTEFVDTVAQLPQRVEGLRALVVTGAGDKAFVGGADIDEMAAITDGEGARRFITRVHRCCDVLRALPVPVIARIQGFTLGAGLELAAACDLRVAADSAQFGMPEVKLGIPSVVEAALLPDLVGWGRAREMLLLGENFGAAEALAWGMVERVVPADQLDAVVARWIDSLLHTGVQAVRIQKQLIQRWEELPMRDAVQAGIDAFASAWDSPEPQRMMADFQTQRKARRAARD